jgi:hypothetical protein
MALEKFPWGKLVEEKFYYGDLKKIQQQGNNVEELDTKYISSQS